MKKNIVAKMLAWGTRFVFLLTALVYSAALIGQEKETKEVNINLNSKSQPDNFFSQPWVWVVGGAVFLLLLVALLRNNSSKT